MERCYEVLGVRADASPDELRQAYRDLVKVWHPDRFGGDARLQELALRSQIRGTIAFAATTRLLHCSLSQDSEARTDGRIAQEL